ncbi:COG4280 domain-containing protein [Sneathiella sp.]|uniref:COG4280 domain-containing protein n=1 Tax=Sneathiella sp. TaxID=1964365 RepID=UPI003564F3C8
MDMASWGLTGPTVIVVIAAFLASLVEIVEALTIILAVGVVRGWRPALIGAGAGIALLVILVAIFGPLLSRVPIQWLQLGVGILLLLFGMRWLRKAVLRSAGIISLHDEAAIFDRESRALQKDGRSRTTLDPIAVITSFKAVVLEGLEVIFIVIATGSAGGMLIPASIGAFAAMVLVFGIGFIVHKPLANVPENKLKFVVGILLSAFGVFWIGEGAGFAWPGAEFAVLALIAGFLVVALLAVKLAHRTTSMAEVS